MLANLWKRGVDFLGSRFAIMGGAMRRIYRIFKCG